MRTSKSRWNADATSKGHSVADTLASSHSAQRQAESTKSSSTAFVDNRAQPSITQLQSAANPIPQKSSSVLQRKPGDEALIAEIKGMSNGHEEWSVKGTEIFRFAQWIKKKRERTDLSTGASDSSDPLWLINKHKLLSHSLIDQLFKELNLKNEVEPPERPSKEQLEARQVELSNNKAVLAQRENIRKLQDGKLTEEQLSMDKPALMREYARLTSK